jgi:hypothetical protein
MCKKKAVCGVVFSSQVAEIHLRNHSALNTWFFLFPSLMLWKAEGICGTFYIL